MIKGEDEEPSNLERLLLITVIVLFACAIGAYIYDYTQHAELTPLEAVYFGIITLTTIGLGDYAPDVGDPDFGWGTFVVFTVWTMMGLSSVAHLLSIIGECISKSWEKDGEDEEQNDPVLMVQRVFPRSRTVSRVQVHPEQSSENADETEKQSDNRDGDVLDQERLEKECSEILTTEEVAALSTLLAKVPQDILKRCMVGERSLGAGVTEVSGT